MAILTLATNPRSDTSTIATSGGVASGRPKMWFDDTWTATYSPNDVLLALDRAIEYFVRRESGET